MKGRNNKGRFIKGHSIGLRFGHGQKMGDNTGKPSPTKGKKYSKEFGRKISKRQKGRTLSGEWKKNISNALKGKKKSEEHRQNIIRSLIGRKQPPRSEELRKKMSEVRKGKKRSKETRIRMSLSRKRGSANHFWKGGISSQNVKERMSLKYKIWREEVFKRDNYTCVTCGKIGGRLNADHINRFADYPELRYELSNGRTLCEKCHKKTVTFGRWGKCKGRFQEFLQEAVSK